MIIGEDPIILVSLTSTSDTCRICMKKVITELCKSSSYLVGCAIASFYKLPKYQDEYK